MTNKCRLSDNTLRYLEQYKSILSEMIHNMNAATQTRSISGSFISQMIPHHRAAIEMSENLLRFTINIPLQDIALNIISSQTESIQYMRKVCLKCQTCLNSPQELAAYMERDHCIMKNMFEEMGNAGEDNCIDADFMREMIPHHEGAVRMSENALRFPICQELVPQLNEIIASQKRGIKEMQRLLMRIRCC